MFLSRIGTSIEKESRFVVAGMGMGRVGVTAKDTGFLWGWWKCPKTDCGAGCTFVCPACYSTSVNPLKTIDLCILSGWIVWYMNYISKTFFTKNPPIKWNEDNVFNIWMNQAVKSHSPCSSPGHSLAPNEEDSRGVRVSDTSPGCLAGWGQALGFSFQQAIVCNNNKTMVVVMGLQQAPVGQ